MTHLSDPEMQTTAQGSTLRPGLNRRRFLMASATATAALGLGFSLTGCSPTPLGMSGTFFQPWMDHTNWPKETWRVKCLQMKELGCKDITIQWVGERSTEHDWRLSDETLKSIFDIADELDLKIRLGLPYDTRWWQVLESKSIEPIVEFLNEAKQRMEQFITQSRWHVRPAFLGWYIPYEIEQYSWATEQRKELLVNWLVAIVGSTRGTTQHPVAISTYHSAIVSESSLAQLWNIITERVALRPMIQDGVGVEGMANYAKLEPLRDLLKQKHIAFDLIIELFEEIKNDHLSSVDFQARSASLVRIKQQIEIAKTFGAEQLVSFSLDPWVMGDTAEARLLLKNWPT